MGPMCIRRLSLIIATYGRPAALNDLLRGCSRLQRPPDEVLIVDQLHEQLGWSGLAADTVRRCEVKDIPLKVFRLDKPNLPLARNVGSMFAAGDIVLFLDDDVVLESEIVKGHLGGYIDSATASVAGRLFGNPYWPRSTDDGAIMPYGLGGNISFLRSALLSIGGFDRRFTPCSIGEEIDACHRLRRSGRTIRYVASAGVKHLDMPGGEKSHIGTFGYHESFVRNMTLLALRNYGAAGAFTLAKHLEWMRTKDDTAAALKGWKRALVEWRRDDLFKNGIDLGEAIAEEVTASPGPEG